MTTTDTKTDNTYNLTVACCFTGGELPRWTYELNGAFDCGHLENGIDAHVATLCGVAHAAKTLPSGSKLQIAVTDVRMVKLGTRLAKKDATSLLFPFLPIIPAHRAAWESVLHLLEGLQVTWKLKDAYPPLFDLIEEKAKQAAEVTA